MPDADDFMAQHLDSAKIEGAVKSFPGATKVTGPTAKNPKGTFVEYEVQCDPASPLALLHVYTRGDGRITLQPKVGKNQPLSQLIAQHVAQHAAAVKHKSKPLSIKNVSEEEWKFLLEALKEEGLKLTQEQHADAERWKVLASGKDEVVIHRYKTGRFLMQGRAVNAYGKVVDALTYLGDDKKAVVEAQLETVEAKAVTVDKLFAELEHRMPKACAFMNDTVKCIFAPAFALTKLEIDLPDYAALTHPALRGLEACLKDLFLKHNIVVQKAFGIGAHFDQTSVKLIATTAAKIPCAPSRAALESFFAIYNAHRHSLFHVDATTVTSRTIDSRKEAVKIVDSIVFTVEKGFEAIPP